MLRTFSAASAAACAAALGCVLLAASKEFNSQRWYAESFSFGMTGLLDIRLVALAADHDLSFFREPAHDVEDFLLLHLDFRHAHHAFGLEVLLERLPGARRHVADDLFPQGLGRSLE